MPVYSTSSVAASGSVGKIYVTVGGDPGGGSGGVVEVTVVVALEEATYSITGVDPTTGAASLEGGVGVRWTGVQYEPPGEAVLTLDYSTTGSEGTNFMVTVIPPGDDPSSSEWGWIPGEGVLLLSKMGVMDWLGAIHPELIDMLKARAVKPDPPEPTEPTEVA